MRTILRYCFLLSWFISTAQLPVKVKFSKGDEIELTKDFRLLLIGTNQTTIAFDSQTDELKKTYEIELSNLENITASFEYRTENEPWTNIEYPISIESGLMRLEILLSFRLNDSNIEYLREFTVNKYFSTDRIIIEPVFEREIGSQPVFMLVNNSDSVYYGKSETNHFYGQISQLMLFEQTELGWIDHPFSYCLSTVLEKPLEPLDTAFSWSPSYNPGDEFRIKRPGRYKYVVDLGFDNYRNGIPLNLVNSGMPQLRTRNFLELETEFEIN